jgi:hypothetical protein
VSEVPPEDRAPEITIREAFLNNATLPARDTQFAGFAKLLLDDLIETNALDMLDARTELK